MDQCWRAYLAGGAVVVGAYLLVPAGLLRDAVYLAVGLSSVLAVVAGVLLHRPARRAPWLWMAAGELCWVVGDSLWSWYADVAHVAPYPSAADGFYLAGYPAIVVGLALLVRLRQRGLDPAGVLDSTTLTAGLGLVSWVVVATPVLHGSGQPPLEVAVGLAYPAADIALAALLVRLVIVPGARTASFRLLTAAVACMYVADVVFAVLSARWSYEGSDLDPAWLASYVLWGACALHPSVRALSEPGEAETPPFTTRRLAALTAAVLVAPGVLAVESLLGATLDVWPVVLGSAGLFLLVVARMRAAVHEATAAARQRARLQDDLAHQASHDPLTDLANRSRALELVEAALHRGQRSSAPVGLLVVDLDQFKAVNDAHGQTAGDAVLRLTAQRLRSAVRAGDSVGRLGGDEFVVLVETLDTEAALLDLAGRLLEALRAPVEVCGQQVTTSASVGVAVSRDGATDAGHLLAQADVAAHRAKAGGRGRVEVFDEALRREMAEREALDREVRAGLERGEFALHYQPVVEVGSGAVAGYEALIRWQHPRRGPVPPDAFVPAAERSDLVCALDRWVLGEATRQLREWSDADPAAWESATVAVNISGRHLADPGVVADVRRALDASGTLPRQLVLEITETVLVDDPAADASLRALRELGVGISIDDFGTGYTSIGQLQHLHADTLKIDRSFVASSAPGAHELVGLLVHAAHAFGLRVVAEGVETEEHLALLRAVGCDQAQGWYFARPRPAAQVAQPRRSSPATSVAQ